MAPCDPSDGSGSDRSCLDNGGVTRVSGAHRVPGPTTYHRTPVSRMESSPSQQLRDTTEFPIRSLEAQRDAVARAATNQAGHVESLADLAPRRRRPEHEASMARQWLPLSERICYF